MKTLLATLAISTALAGPPALAQDMGSQGMGAQGAMPQDQDAGAVPPPPPPMGADLASVPGIDAIHAREDRDGARIQSAVAAGDMAPSEAHRVQEELANIRTQEAELAHRDGAGLNATDRQFINDRLDQLGRSIHWMRTREGGGW